MKNIRESLDLFLLDPEKTREDLIAASLEAIEKGFFGITVSPRYLREILEISKGKTVRLSSPVSYPHGTSTHYSKLFEALEILRIGAACIDIPLHPGALKGGEFKALRSEMEEIMDRTPECRHRFALPVDQIDEGVLNKILKIINKIKPQSVRIDRSKEYASGNRKLSLIEKALDEEISLEISGHFESSEEIRSCLVDRIKTIGVYINDKVLDDDF